MKTCEFCAHFFQTGMAKSMGNGNSGYCLLIQNDDSIGVARNEQGVRIAKQNAIKRKIETCGEFVKGCR